MRAFKKDLADQIGRAWYRDMEARSQNIALGTIQIALTASPEGKITNVRVLSNTSNKLFAKICLSAIQHAKLPPVPQELLSDGKFEDEITFTVFPKQRSRSHDAVIRVYDSTGNVIETHEHAGEFKDF